MTNPFEAARTFEIPDSLPLVPVRDLVVFPYMIVPLFVGREISMTAVEDAMAKDRLLFLASQKDMSEERPEADGIHEIGSVGMVMRLRKLPDGRLKLLVQGLAKGRFTEVLQTSPFLRVRVEEIPEPPVELDGPDGEALVRTTRKNLQEIIELGKSLSPDVMTIIAGIHHPGRLADLVAAHLSLGVVEAQALLEIEDPMERLRRVNEHLVRELAVQKVQSEIQAQAREEMSRSQREYILREHLRQIKAELGEGDGKAEEIDELRLRIARARMPAEVEAEANKQLRRLEGMSSDSAEAAVIRTYLDTLTELPWSVRTEDVLDLARAREVLDEDHHGLEEVKERLLEFLGVRKLKAQTKGPILCLVGPPGVGKTSLGKSVARAMGRSFARVSLGGVRDESEIRGHRRTYVGAMPGRIVSAIKQAGTRNPVLVLDEIDKLGQDYRGDPSSALLEVLDPEQNSTFMDHYLEVEYDLSSVMFVTTANTLNIPPALMDRMEIIRIAGYTEDEKVEIAKRHLLPKAIRDHALQPKEFSISEDAIREIVQTYTREAGVRSLERELMKVARKAVTEIIRTKKPSVDVTKDNLADYLGVPRFRFGQVEGEDQIGVVTGLAWTEVGGELLTIEGVMMPGKGKMTVTGNLKDVMKESISAAASYVRSRALSFGVEPPLFDKRDIHVHVPEGATPKDGPSAGTAMATAIVSVMTGIPVRKDVAMTGEITLRGRVLPIGGLKEKLLAALRGGIKKVLIPEENAKDLADIPENVKSGMEIVPVSHVGEVLKHALVRMPEPIEWTEPEEPIAKPGARDQSGATLAH